MSVRYAVNGHLAPQEAADLLRATDFLRPLDDLGRVQRMIDNSDVLITARDGERLAGYIRALTDYAYYCLVTDVAVDPAYQGRGIGRELLRLLREQTGDEVNMVLTASETGDSFYTHLGWEKLDRGYRQRRTR